jgi:ribose transport system substrate-binding protein
MTIAGLGDESGISKTGKKESSQMGTRHRSKTAGRRRNGRYLIPLLATIILGLAACSSSGSSGSTPGSSSKPSAATKIPKSKIKIAIVAGGPNVYFTTWGLVAQALSKQLGVTVTYVVPPTPTYDPSVEVSTIDSLVAQGYNAFAVFPDGESAIIPTYQRLISRGIPVFDLAGCTTDPTPALLCYATNVEASANDETQVLQKAMGGSGNIAFLTGLLTDANTALRENGVKDAVTASDGKLKLAQVVSNIDDPSAAPPAIESLLAAKGGVLNGMLSTDYYPSVAAASILTSDPQFRHILFIGQDNSPTVLSAVQKGYIYGTMLQNDWGQAQVAITWLYDIVAKGCTVNPNGPFTPIPGPTSHFINSGYLFVSKATVGQYIGNPASIPSNTAQVLAETDKFLSCP